MQVKKARINAFCQLFGLDSKNSRIVASRKIKMQYEKLKPFEKLFNIMETEDIETLLKFIDDKTNEYTLHLKRGDDTVIESSSSILMSIKIGDTTCNTINQSDDQIIQKRKSQLSYPRYDNFDEEYDFDLWVESSFKEQTKLHSFEAYNALYDGKSNDDVSYLEAEYLLENNLSDTVDIGDYENFVWEKHRLQNLLCKEVFEKNKAGLESFVEEKEMLDFLLEKIFPNQFALQNQASGYKIPTKIYNEWACEGMLKYLLPYIKPLSARKTL